jgi:hypothetical protein
MAMDALRLIMSGAVVGQELAAEFGPLPPAFLPVGVKRLYELQLAALAGAGPVHLVLPETFAIPDYDRARLAELSVEITLLPDGLRLGEAVVYAINAIGAGDRPVHILHGDTLINEPPLDRSDIIVGGVQAQAYAWAEIAMDADRVAALESVPAGEEGQGRPVAAGYFAFSSSLGLVRSLTRARGDFVEGINHYLGGHEVAMEPAADWLDFGHLQTFFQSRLAVATARAFNSVRINGLTAYKSSADQAKMAAESSWLAAAPAALKPYCARLVDAGAAEGHGFYQTEYEYLPTLSELFVYGAIGRRAWLAVLASAEDFMRLCALYRGPGAAGDALRTLAVDKTFERLAMIARTTDIPIDKPLSFEGRPTPSLTDVAERLAGALKLDGDRRESVMHGDFCFSNILYNARVRRIKAIDPRGLVGESPSLYGDPRYDLAKLAHSISGRYDQIIAGRCRARREGRDFGIEFETLACQPWLDAALADLRVDGISGADPTVRAATAGLFLSMIPLHADRPDRQQAFVANALRLYLELDQT